MYTAVQSQSAVTDHLKSSQPGLHGSIVVLPAETQRQSKVVYHCKVPINHFIRCISICPVSTKTCREITAGKLGQALHSYVMTSRSEAGLCTNAG